MIVNRSVVEKKINQGQFDIIIILINLYFLMSYFALFNADLRYLKYSLPLIAGALFLYKEYSRESLTALIVRQYITKFIKFYAFLFLCFFIIQISTFTISFRFFANFLFVLLPALFVYFIVPFIKAEKVDYYFKYISILTIVGYIIEKHESIVLTLMNWKQLLIGLEDSSVASESNLYPFLLAFLFLFSFYYKFAWWQTLVILFFVLLSFKRIVILGVILFVIIRAVPKLYSKSVKHSNISSLLFSCFALAVIVLYYYIANGYFDEYLYSKFGLYTNALLQGRQVFYELAIAHNKNIFIGSGVGSIDNLLIKHKADVGDSTNLHSELLRWFLETGVFSYFIWMYTFFRNSLNTRFSFLLFLFLFILLLTDNVFIYFDCMFYVYILTIFSILKEGRIKLVKHETISRLEPQYV